MHLIASGQQPAPAYVFILMAIAIPLWACFVGWALSVMSGWRALSRKYPRSEKALPGTVFKRQSGRVGWVNFNNCMNVSVGTEGIGLTVSWPFKYLFPDMLLPWSSLSEPVVRKFLWHTSVEFQVGVPAIGKIRLPKKIFDQTPSPSSFLRP